MCLVEGYEPLPVLTCFMSITVIFRLFVPFRRRINIVFVCPVYPPYSVVLLSIGLTASISSVESAGFATALQGFVIISCLSFVRRPPPFFSFYIFSVLPRRESSSRLCFSCTSRINVNLVLSFPDILGEPSIVRSQGLYSGTHFFIWLLFTV